MQLTHPILSISEAQSLEDLVFAGNTDAISAAMYAAGKGIGCALLQDLAEVRPVPEVLNILVLQGKGHNGGDALIAAAEMVVQKPGSSVTVVSVFPVARWKELTLKAFQELQSLAANGIRIQHHIWDPKTVPGVLAHEAFDCVLDGLLGQGFVGDLRSPIREVLLWVNDLSQRPGLRASVDVPSGLLEDKTEIAFEADFTYITGIPKNHLFTAFNNPWTGRLRLIDLGLLKDPRLHKKNHRLVPGDYFKSLCGLRSHMSYKHQVGHVLLVGGSAAMPGAILMAAKAAVQAGVGLATVALPADIHPFVAPHVPEVMWEPTPCSLEGSFDLDILRRLYLNLSSYQAIVVGPGMLRDRQNIFIICRLIREIALPIVLDASALSSDCLNALIGRPLNFPKVILTPHIGEYMRIRGAKFENYDPEDFMHFCEKYNVITLLKGPISRISDGQLLLEAPVGGPVLARGGTGDILAGMIGALLAMQPDQPLRALLNAVTWHGAAADQLARHYGQQAVRSTQLIDFLHSSLRY